MKKIVSLMMSVIVLTLSGARSTQAQGLLNFNPKASQSAPKLSKAQPAPIAQKATNKPAITFQVPENDPVAVTPVQPVFRPVENDDRLVAMAPDELFDGGSNSLVARAVGSAEGTRTPDGNKTWAYYGHTDPGNGVWNMGSFSYQHGAGSPDEADRRQLSRLRGQYNMIEQSARSVGLRLGLEEQLNGIDLANQAPLAALERGGYVDRLREAYAQGLRGSEAVLQARTYSYINPRTNQWDAPGLGNNFHSISRDQARRQNAIYDAIQNHQQQIARSRSQDNSKLSQIPENP
ncbi:hypothetical protein [Leptolyngbya sp. NIES-2104]|uniref:hypothetical protein n=1 Tax=Leptolyngbya sp. NIES-2104 TaxID=1552121 RepID=UPI0006EC6A14|nr:hypothetical protein [Leptolyngbya sp. NIES-2104]GAP98314.1 LysM domain protein [Leptolyngbya sp. NIES-2104]